MTMLHRLYVEQGQRPWLDNLTRGYLRDGTLAELVGRRIRDVTLENSSVAGFHESFQTMMVGLAAKASQLVRR